MGSVTDRSLKSIAKSSDENSCQTKVDSPESCIKIRFIILLLSTLGTICMFACRVCINVAIVSMVKDDKIIDTLNANVSNSSLDVHIVDTRLNYKSGIFEWSQSLQGVILGSYFYGYTATQLVAGVLTEKVDPVKFSGFGILAGSILTISIPFLAEVHVSLVILAMVLMGILHGPSLSCFLKIIKYWVPNTEISAAISLLPFGWGFGVGFTMSLTAYMCENGFAGGWPSAFISIGAATILWCILWLFYATTRPSHHRHVSKLELSIIQEGKHIEERISGKKASLKWSSVLSSMAIWASCFTKITYNFSAAVITAKLPSYLKTVLKLELQNNGLINSLLYLCVCSANLFAGFASDFLISRVKMDKTLVRKVFQTAANGIAAVCLFLIPFSSHATVIIALFIFAATSIGLVTGGEQPIVADMAPDFIGVIFGFCNTFAAAQGILAPLVIGLVLDSSLETIAAWNVVLFGSSALLVSGIIFFNVFGTAKPQPWGVIS